MLIYYQHHTQSNGSRTNNDVNKSTTTESRTATAHTRTGAMHTRTAAQHRTPTVCAQLSVPNCCAQLSVPNIVPNCCAQLSAPNMPNPAAQHRTPTATRSVPIIIVPSRSAPKNQRGARASPAPAPENKRGARTCPASNMSGPGCQLPSTVPDNSRGPRTKLIIYQQNPHSWTRVRGGSTFSPQHQLVWVSLTCSPEHRGRQCKNFTFLAGSVKWHRYCYCCCGSHYGSPILKKKEE